MNNELLTILDELNTSSAKKDLCHNTKIDIPCTWVTCSCCPIFGLKKETDAYLNHFLNAMGRII